MSIDTLILYGSAARNEQHVNSDLDLLGVVKDGDHAMIVKQKVNLAIYPINKLMEMCENGDLFLLHVLKEGRAIYDKYDSLAALQSKFNYRKNYSVEIEAATSLGWALVDVADKSANIALVNKRIAWCVRTILIAKSAEKGAAVFSSSALAAFVRWPVAYELIENKNNPHFDIQVIRNFSEFLFRFGAKGIKGLTGESFESYRRAFAESGNVVGEQTMKLLDTLKSNVSY